VKSARQTLVLRGPAEGLHNSNSNSNSNNNNRYHNNIVDENVNGGYELHNDDTYFNDCVVVNNNEL